MEKRGTAFFVQRPRTFRDLLKPHLLAVEQDYKIVKVIELSELDYENFIEDMLVERKFIKENALIDKEGKVLPCLLVKQEGKIGGVLVIPEKESVSRAAYLF